VFFVLTLSKKHRKVLRLNVSVVTIFGVATLFGFYFGVYFLDLRYTIDLLEQVIGQRAVTSDSVGVRVEQIVKVFNYFYEFPLSIFGGFGPAKTEFRLLESGYAYVLFRHGLIGFIFYLVMFISIFVFAIKRAVQIKSSLHLAIALYVFSFPLLLSSSMHIEHPKASFFFIIIFSTMLAEIRSSSREKVTYS
jgi:hypothetical protein